MTDLAHLTSGRVINPNNPAEIGYPPTFPIEVALRVAPIKDICAAYNLSEEDWGHLRRDPVFVSDLKKAVDMVKQEGMSFKLKARMQSEELLKTSWQMIHDQEVTPAVRADLLKFTVRCAGLEAGPKDQQGSGNTLQIQINLG